MIEIRGLSSYVHYAYYMFEIRKINKTAFFRLKKYIYNNIKFDVDLSM